MLNIGRFEFKGGIFVGDEPIGFGKEPDSLLTKDVVECVDLSIEHTPVLPNPIKGDEILSRDWPRSLYPVEARKTQGEEYLLVRGEVGEEKECEWVTAEEVKVMRARYIMWRNYLIKQMALDQMPWFRRQAALSIFFPEGVYIPPPKLAKMMFGGAGRGDANDTPAAP
jgi:hypothetical protein